MRQFHYHGILADLTDAIREASEARDLIEACPPVIPELPKAKKGKKKRKAKADTPVDDGETTIEVPLKKGTQAVKMSHIKIVAGETDAVAYRQAKMLAGRLIELVQYAERCNSAARRLRSDWMATIVGQYLYKLLHRLPIHSFLTYINANSVAARSVPICREELEVYL
ncbi:MAG: hypothetical protein AAFV93_14670 [Chloroflexota bacterium]